MRNNLKGQVYVIRIYNKQLLLFKLDIILKLG